MSVFRDWLQVNATALVVVLVLAVGCWAAWTGLLWFVNGGWRGRG